MNDAGGGGEGAGQTWGVIDPAHGAVGNTRGQASPDGGQTCTQTVVAQVWYTRFPVAVSGVQHGYQPVTTTQIFGEFNTWLESTSGQGLPPGYFGFCPVSVSMPFAGMVPLSSLGRYT